MTDSSNSGLGVTESAARERKDGQKELDLDQLVPGGLWRGVYLIREALPDITYGKMLSACHVTTGENVVLRSFRVSDSIRARTWSQLYEYKGPGLIPLLEAIESEGRRIEVTRAADATHLGTWLGGKPASEKDVRSIVRQLARVLSGVHEKSVAHLSLKPDNILIESAGGEPQIKITGLEAATEFSSNGLVSISVDPFYAPPEAIGILQHHCGSGLRAWDWWSVGRIVQELILGRHILGVLLDRDVSRRTPELMMRAERVLKEKENPGQRAGAVEAMSAMSPELTSLLRGLLSSSRDARWGSSEINRWLNGETVKDRYHLSAYERLFTWKGQSFAIPEAAEFFRRDAHWAEGVENIFGTSPANTLLAFIAEEGDWRDAHRRIQDLVKLPESAAFVDIDRSASQDVVTALALALLAEGPLELRDRRVDASLLATLLSPEAQPSGLSIAQSLTERTMVQQIGLVDVETGRFLAEFERSSSAAVTLAAQHHWISRADRTSWAQLLSLTLLPESELRGRLERLRATFAASRDEALHQLFNKPELNHGELSVLAFVGNESDRFRFVTHETWVGEKYQLLKEKGETVAQAATWVSLATALRTGPHLAGPWPLTAIFWIALTAPLALAFPGRVTLGLVVSLSAFACVLRFLLLKSAARELRQRIPSEPKLVSASECDIRARQLMNMPEAPRSRELAGNLKEIETGIRSLKSNKRLEMVAAPARFLALRLAALVSGVVLVSGFAGTGYGVVKHPPTLPALLAAWLHPRDQATRDAKRAADVKRAAEAQKERAANERNDRRKNDEGGDAKISWSFRPSPNPQSIRVTKVLEPNVEQNQEARETGEYLARPYTPSTISDLIAFRVTTDSGVGLMLFDGKSGKIADKRLYIVPYVPLARSWMIIGEHRAIFLEDN